MSDDTYTFRRVTLGDLSLLRTWHSNPHIKQWWGEWRPFTGKDLTDPRVARWIVVINDQPIGFMQDYTVHGWKDHHFADLPEGSRGIDQFIGEPRMLGAGHGTAFIRQRMRILFDAGASVIATDPHPDNARAIAVYEKLGFKQSGPPQETQWGLILPMRARQ